MDFLLKMMFFFYHPIKQPSVGAGPYLAGDGFFLSLPDYIRLHQITCRICRELPHEFVVGFSQVNPMTDSYVCLIFGSTFTINIPQFCQHQYHTYGSVMGLWVFLLGKIISDDSRQSYDSGKVDTIPQSSPFLEVLKKTSFQSWLVHMIGPTIIFS